jgi:hypothetical protein
MIASRNQALEFPACPIIRAALTRKVPARICVEPIKIQKVPGVLPNERADEFSLHAKRATHVRRFAVNLSRSLRIDVARVD